MSFVDSTMSSGPSSGTADSLANKHALYLSWDLRGDHHAAVRPTADELVDHGWEVTVVAGSDEASGGSPGGDGATWFGPDVRLVTVPSDLSSRGGALLDAVVRLHETHPITLMVAGGGPASGIRAAQHLWDKERVPFVLDLHDSAAILRFTRDGEGTDGSAVTGTAAELLAEAIEVWFPDDTSREACEAACPSVVSKSRVVTPALKQPVGAAEARGGRRAAVADLGPRVESAHTMQRLLQERGASAPAEVTVFEVPSPSTRTVRMMDTLRAAGVVTKAVHWGAKTELVQGLGFRSITFVNRKYSLYSQVRAHLAEVASAEPGTEEGRLRDLYQAMLDIPVPATRDIWQDLKIWSQDWFDVARLFARYPSPVFWAADLNALPPAVWAKHAVPGTRVIFDAHELFTELDYLDPTQRAEWEDIAQHFLPEVDLVITVGKGIAGELAKRYGLPRVEVVESLSLPTRYPRSDVRRVVGVAEGTPLVVHVGNVSGNRNPLLAVQLLQRDPRVHFAFVGVVKGTMADTLSRAAEDAGVLDRLHLVGSVPMEELQHFLSTADVSAILYSPRTSENLRLAMPNKLFDALGAGVPCVAAAGTAAAEYLEHEGLGHEFADGDPGSLAAAIETVLADTTLHDRVRQSAPRFLWPAIEPRLLELVADELAAAHFSGSTDRPPALVSSGPQTQTRKASGSYSWRSAPMKRAQRALAWRLRRLALRLER